MKNEACTWCTSNKCATKHISIKKIEPDDVDVSFKVCDSCYKNWLEQTWPTYLSKEKINYFETKNIKPLKIVELKCEW